MLSFEIINGLILGACGLGLLYALINAIWLSKIRVGASADYK
jgi:hypothetical protein